MTPYKDAKFRRACRLKLSTPLSDIEFERFMFEAEARGLNPILGHLWVQKRHDRRTNQDKITFETTIDALRYIAQQTGQYCGQDPPKFTYHKDSGRIESVTVTVYRYHNEMKDRMPYSATVFFDEFVQRNREGKPVDMWNRMPRSQLTKCGESHAFRKGFPELGQIYTAEEMGQSDNTGPTTPPDPSGKSPPQGSTTEPIASDPPSHGTNEDDAETARREYIALCDEFSVDAKVLEAALCKMIGADTLAEADPFTILSKLSTLRELGKEGALERIRGLVWARSEPQTTSAAANNKMPSARAGTTALEALATLGAALGGLKPVYEYLERKHGTRMINEVTTPDVVRLSKMTLENLQAELKT